MSQSERTKRIEYWDGKEWHEAYFAINTSRELLNQIYGKGCWVERNK